MRSEEEIRRAAEALNQLSVRFREAGRIYDSRMQVAIASCLLWCIGEDVNNTQAMIKKAIGEMSKHN